MAQEEHHCSNCCNNTPRKTIKTIYGIFHVCQQGLGYFDGSTCELWNIPANNTK